MLYIVEAVEVIEGSGGMRGLRSAGALSSAKKTQVLSVSQLRRQNSKLAHRKHSDASPIKFKKLPSQPASAAAAVFKP
jgi:hypothetical protein